MSDTIPACPACDSADLYKRQPKVSSPQDHDHTYRCQACGERFDDPEWRERGHSGNSVRNSTLAGKLLDADPEEVGGD